MRSILRREKFVILVLGIIVITAFAVRFYNFHDWLYFKMDQSRDAFLIDNVVKSGPGYLPLLGPRAGATKVSHGYLRLGPAFYYFQYISAKIFNSTQPDVLAYPDLFFSILTIPLLYLFVRFYFSKINSLLITTMYAFSFIVIQYSRFAWNPNSLLFFTLLSFYSLLKFLNTEEKIKKIIWTILWAIGVGIGSQLHFIGLFGLIGISAAILFIHYRPWSKTQRKKLKSGRVWKKFALYFFTFFATFLLIFSPVIISDVMKKGENTKNFIEAFSTKPKKKPFFYKLNRSINKQAKYYCLLTTSQCYQGKADFNSKVLVLSVAIMLSGIVLSIYNLVRKKYGQNDNIKKDFLWLLLLWFWVLFILAVPLYSSLRARFFIFVFPLPFIFLGLVYEYLESILSKRAVYVAVLATAGIIFLNTKGTRAWFNEQKESQMRSLNINQTLILKNQDGVTLGQLEKAADYMYRQTKPGNVIYYYVKPEHVLPIKYALLMENDPNLGYTTISNTHDSQGQYFAIIPSKKTPEYLKTKFKDNFEVMDSFLAGQIRVYELKFEGQNEVGNFKFNREAGETDRIFWKDVFGIKGNGPANKIQGAE